MSPGSLPCAQKNMHSDYGQSQPQAAYAAFTHGVRHKMAYFMRKIEELDQYLQSWHAYRWEIHTGFIWMPYYTISLLERRTVALPVRCGGHTSFNKVGIRGVSNIHVCLGTGFWYTGQCLQNHMIHNNMNLSNMYIHENEDWKLCGNLYRWFI